MADDRFEEEICGNTNDIMMTDSVKKIAEGRLVVLQRRMLGEGLFTV